MSRFPAVGGGDSGPDPVAVKDRAETFVEPGVSVVNSNTDVGRGSVYPATLQPLFDISTPVTGEARLDSFTWITVKSGLGITDKKNITEIKATLEEVGDDRNPTWENTRITDTDGNTYTLDHESYVVGAGVVEHSATEFDDLFITVDKVEFLFENRSTLRDTTISISEVEHRGKGGSGTAIIEFSQPEDIFRWDAATFQTIGDPLRIDIFIEQSTDGGSTWTEIAGPISRGHIISALPDSRVRFRVEFSDGPTETPELAALYRRWVV